MARGREPPASDPAYPARRRYEMEVDRPYQPNTLALVRKEQCWFWINCPHADCGRSVPMAVAPRIILLGPDYEIEEFRRRAKCSQCGRKAVQTTMPSGGRQRCWVVAVAERLCREREGHCRHARPAVLPKREEQE